uniref:Nfe2 like bZIP transcription factor 3 n=1 Tax=Paramormyrops kingsleyae TaxID=1676925 RepID=A0A3B3R384_9TELE|nr:nuclear factor erythroid 2-related factor 1-like [Paramormyrops kingsleyae]
MQYLKKYFSEGLIQFTILLSLMGVRVDVTLDTYLTGYLSPLLETNVGQSSAYVQTPVHNLRDTLDGYSLHPKCPDLDSYFASRRLLDEVRTLGSPRFPTRLSAWLVHLVPSGSDSAGSGEARGGAPALADAADVNRAVGEEGDTCASNSSASRRDESRRAAQEGDARPCPSPAACELSKEDSQPLRNVPWNLSQDAVVPVDQVADAAELTGRRELAIRQLAHSDSLEESFLSSSNIPLSQPSSSPDTQAASRPDTQAASRPDTQAASRPDTQAASRPDRQWHDFLSLSGFDDLELDVPLRASDLGVDISSALSQDVSLQDALVTGGGTEARRALRQESTNSTHSDSLLGAGDLPMHLLLPVENGSRNGTFNGSLSGCLDEAVFEQINLLGLGLEGLDTQLLEERDSDSGLSMSSSFRSLRSPSSSEASSGELYGDDNGAAGCLSAAELLDSGAAAASPRWSNSELAECVQHNHTYNAAFQRSATCCQEDLGHAVHHKDIKEEVLSEDEEEEEEEEEVELSRDERHARALRIPFSVSEIVNMPVEDFLELLTRRGLTQAQVALLRDIRRRGKNKLAAQNCRKRKLDVISGLEGEVERLGRQRDRLLRERTQHSRALCAMKQKLEQLSQDLLSRLRDERGRPISPSCYTLQCGSDGRVLVLPRRHISGQPKTEKRRSDKKH